MGAWVGIAGWVPGWAIPGYCPPSGFARGEVHMQRSGPRKPLQGAGVGGIWSSDVPAAGTGYPHPCGARSAHPWTSLGYPSECRLWANKARFQSISYKVSQNGQVSPINVEKACHSPYFQNELGKSPLEILRFLYLRAFSHKELMGHFAPYLGLYCQMTKCRRCAHRCTREGDGQIPPLVTPASWLL